MPKCFKCDKQATKQLGDSDGKPFYACGEHADEIVKSGAMVISVPENQ